MYVHGSVCPNKSRKNNVADFLEERKSFEKGNA
jgi:hypothetical protein